MKTKKNFITILALSAIVMSLSSCGSILPSMGYYTGSGNLNAIASDYIIGATGQRGGIIGDRISSIAGCWYENGVTIAATSKPNWYSVTRNGVTNVMYLMPFNEALRKIPGGTVVLSFKPEDNSIGWNSTYRVPTWIIKTNRGDARVSQYGCFFRKK